MGSWAGCTKFNQLWLNAKCGRHWCHEPNTKWYGEKSVSRGEWVVPGICIEDLKKRRIKDSTLIMKLIYKQLAHHSKGTEKAAVWLRHAAPESCGFERRVYCKKSMANRQWMLK
ncbi:MAG: hypothetical protein D6694_01845 [Gammaproteobacteria bacterium]|nr:MAG: hypothetical protein D6694_01845 [Gammaproteobacteria bacterium]